VSDGLRVEHEICPRGADGYYGSVDPEMDPGELWSRAGQISDTIGSELGADAVAVPERAGWDAWPNEIGLVSVSRESPPSSRLRVEAAWSDHGASGVDTAP